MIFSHNLRNAVIRDNTYLLADAAFFVNYIEMITGAIRN